MGKLKPIVSIGGREKEVFDICLMRNRWQQQLNTRTMRRTSGVPKPIVKSSGPTKAAGRKPSGIVQSREPTPGGLRRTAAIAFHQSGRAQALRYRAIARGDTGRLAPHRYNRVPSKRPGASPPVSYNRANRRRAACAAPLPWWTQTIQGIAEWPRPSRTNDPWCPDCGFAPQPGSTISFLPNWAFPCCPKRMTETLLGVRNSCARQAATVLPGWESRDENPVVHLQPGST